MSTQILPVGTVVELEGATKRIVIIGSAVQSTQENKYYDYIGVPYPEGYINSELMLLFMHKDIKRVLFLGFVDAEAQAFRAKFADTVEKARKNS